MILDLTKVRLAAHLEFYYDKESREVTKMTATSTTSSNETPDPLTEPETDPKKRKKKKLSKEQKEQEERHGNCCTFNIHGNGYCLYFSS